MIEYATCFFCKGSCRRVGKYRHDFTYIIMEKYPEKKKDTSFILCCCLCGSKKSFYEMCEQCKMRRWNHDQFRTDMSPMER